ncbi:MAG TPA: transporter substrate-binding domain-containing protein [Longimicrobiales bacterium]|nr:transporter substrate-binding domain-containing protein [Longimicrobiales bacterium]
MLRILIVALALAGCGGIAAEGELDTARAAGLRVGFATERPYAYISASGEVTGEAVETFRHTAAELGIEPMWVPLEFGELLSALESGRIDVIASGMFITPERAQRVRFTLPTVCVGTAVVLRQDAPAGIVVPADLPACETCRFAVLSGSVESDVVRALGVGDRTEHLPDLSTAAAALELGRADILLISAPTARQLVAAYPSLQLVEPAARSAGDAPAAGTGCAAFALRRDQAELADSLDARLRDFIGTPAHLDLLRSFGFSPGEAAFHP